MTKKYITIFLTCFFFLSSARSSFAATFTHVEQLFDIRTAITDQGKSLPEDIKNTTGNDLRTLERIFELNTSALTTIEAYFRILKIAVSTESEAEPDSVAILNEWLTFIKNQCQYDVEYLDEALNETTDEGVQVQIKKARKNIKKLSKVVNDGIEENKANLRETIETP